MINSEYINVLTNILKLTVIIIGLNHISACCWYGLGTSKGKNGWVYIHGFTNADTSFSYLTALHWSLTQFTPAAMEVHPTNVQERLFAVVTLLFALIVFSSYVSSITQAMNQLRSLNKENSKKLSMLRKFLVHHRVSRDLAFRVRRYLE